MNLINNPSTTDDLKSLYESKLYKDMLVEFEKISGHKLRSEDEDEKYIYARLDNIKRRYLILNIPFKEVLFEFEKEKDNLIRFTDLSVRLFSKEKDKGGEFPEGEGLSKDDEPETIKVLGITRLFLLDKFCELYLLKQGDNERLLNYLKTSRMPGAKKYQGQISRLYKQILNG